MMRLATTVLAFFAATQMSCAQVSVQDGHGGEVTVGPDGINVSQPGKTVNIGGKNVNAIEGGLTAQVAKIETSVYGHCNNSLPLLQRINKLEADNLGHRTSGTPKERIANLAKQLGVNLGAPKIQSSIRATTNSAAGSTSVSVNASAHSDTITINANGGHQVLDVNGAAVVVNADNGDVTLHGPCKNLTVNGDKNKITADSIDSLTVNGANNEFRWRSFGKTIMTDNGTGNAFAALVASPSRSQAPSPSSPSFLGCRSSDISLTSSMMFEDFPSMGSCCTLNGAS